MRTWKQIAHRMAAQVERGVDEHRRARHGVATIVEIHPFRGYGTRERLHVTGRVLRQPRIAPAADRGTAWSNVLETFRRLASAEVEGARIEAAFGGRTVEAVSDHEGYFHLTIPTSSGELGDALRHEVRLRAVEPPSRQPAVAEVIVPPATARFGVISDIDDTIVQTNATSLARMARTVFTRNAHGRLPMEGVAQFYRQLQAGAGGAENNPLFYVSSSPWNFYDLLDQFLTVHGIPHGPLMLQDYGIDDAKLIHSAHDDHKLQQIGEILGTYPALPFVLIGDTGQRDPEIYRQVALAEPRRIRAVYLRDVSPAARDSEVHAIAGELTAAGVAVALIEKTEDAAVHARTLGLIAERALS